MADTPALRRSANKHRGLAPVGGSEHRFGVGGGGTEGCEREIVSRMADQTHTHGLGCCKVSSPLEHSLVA